LITTHQQHHNNIPDIVAFCIVRLSHFLATTIQPDTLRQADRFFVRLQKRQAEAKGDIICVGKIFNLFGIFVKFGLTRFSVIVDTRQEGDQFGLVI
jgi:hypothetical protein